MKNIITQKFAKVNRKNGVEKLYLEFNSKIANRLNLIKESMGARYRTELDKDSHKINIIEDENGANKVTIKKIKI